MFILIIWEILFTPEIWALDYHEVNNKVVAYWEIRIISLIGKKYPRLSRGALLLQIFEARIREMKGLNVVKVYQSLQSGEGAKQEQL